VVNTIVEATVAQRGEGLEARRGRVRRDAWGVSVRVRGGRWRRDGVDSKWDGLQGRPGTENAAEVCY
jgi:hypothetical protein